MLKKKGGGFKGGKRKTRGAVQAKRGPRSFAGLLDEAMLDRVPREIATYATASAGRGRPTSFFFFSFFFKFS